MTRIAIITAALLASAGTVLAHDTRPIDRTQAQQEHEIEKGRYAGQLTRREYRALQAEQARIAELEAHAKKDGVVTAREYRAIRHAQKEAAQHIYSEEHNGRINVWRRWLYRNR